MASPQPKESILKIRPYVAGKSTAKNGMETVKLSSNENPLGPSPDAIAAYEAESKNLFRYPIGSHDSLRSAIAEMEDLPMQQIICGAGSDELISLLIQAYVEKGDEVLYPEHGFLMYKISTLAHGGVPRTAPEVDYTTNVSELLKAVTDKTKIVFLANPNNPTGSYISGAELKRLRDGLPEHVILAIDGAYAEYMQQDDYTDGSELVSSTNNTVMLRTFSKIYGLPALRLGWAYAPESIIDIMNRIRGPFNVNSAALAAGEAAILDTAYTQEMVKANAFERERVSNALKDKFKVYPAYGNFIMVGFGDPARTTAANNHLLERGIIVREIAAYGLEQQLRISIGTAEENDKLLAAFESFND